MFSNKAFVLFLISGLLAACHIEDDLLPSGKDLREQVTVGSLGHLPGQKAVDFTLPNITGDSTRLYDLLAGGSQPADAVVLYFTMWCPTCLAHTDHLYNVVIPQFANRQIRYLVIDYVSGSVTQASAAASSNGYAGSDLLVLADTQQKVFQQFHAAMGSVVVIDSQGSIELNEDYRDGRRILNTLETLLP